MALTDFFLPPLIKFVKDFDYDCRNELKFVIEKFQNLSLKNLSLRNLSLKNFFWSQERGNENKNLNTYPTFNILQSFMSSNIFLQ